MPLVSPAPSDEPVFRRALDAILSDLQHVESNDLGRTAAYLEGIAEPLDDLRQLGLALFAVVTRGTLTLAQGAFGQTEQNTIPNWHRTYYLVIPVEGLFRVREMTNG